MPRHRRGAAADEDQEMPAGRYAAFTLVELLIVVMVLAILAMVVIPRFAAATEEAREATLLSDVQTVQSQIERYKADHHGWGPHLNPNNEGSVLDIDKFVSRLTQKSDEYGTLSATGKFGPYVTDWPKNPYIKDAALAAKVTFNFGPAPRNGKSGWYFDITSMTFAPNSVDGALEQFPAAIPAKTTTVTR